MVNAIRSTENKIKASNSEFIAPWYDHYIRPFGKCHPDFNTVLVGNDPRNVKICVRKPYTSLPITKKSEGYNVKGSPNWKPSNELYRFSRQIYEPNNLPARMYNPHPYCPPNESYNYIHDYYKKDITFNGTGLYTYSQCPSVRQHVYQMM